MVVAIDAGELDGQLVLRIELAPPGLVAAEQGVGPGAEDELIGRIVAAGSDWIIDMGPGAGEEGGRVVAAGEPGKIAAARGSRTAPYLARVLG